MSSFSVQFPPVTGTLSQEQAAYSWRRISASPFEVSTGTLWLFNGSFANYTGLYDGNQMSFNYSISDVNLSAGTYYVDRCHEGGIRVSVWAPSDGDGIRTSLNAGVDAIASDRPDLVIEMAKSR